MYFPFFVAILLASVDANGNFLEPTPLEKMLPPAKDHIILSAIEDALGVEHREATEQRLGPLEALLQPTLAALPKNEFGRFGHKSVRYALHRLFVQRHAWFVKGIELDGDWDGAEPLKMLEGNVPEIVQSIFEQRLGSKGLSSHDIAVMAATLENLAHEESIERLETVYQFLGVDVGSHSREEAEQLLDMYMAVYINNINLMQVNPDKVTPAQIFKVAEDSYPGWKDVVPWVRHIRNEAVGDLDMLSFANVTDVVTLIGERYGRWQAQECSDLKKSLFALEDDGTGRVSLSKFYDRALNHGQWQFGESAAYLRMLGALDETSPSHPKVIVTNYILSPSNCVASSKYYSACCLDECEELIGFFEREIQAPSATPARISELAKLNGSAQAIEKLRVRLDEIAVQNGGVVPLHGRLFAQWMHHAYPHECPYPHLSGTTKPMRTEQFVVDTGLESGATREEMIAYIDVSGSSSADDEEAISWSSEEELFVERPMLGQETPDSRLLTVRTIFRLLAFCVPAASVTAFVLQEGRRIAAAGQGCSALKYSV